MNIDQKIEKKIRFAIICNGSHLQRWQNAVLDELLQLNYVETVALLVPAAQTNVVQTYANPFLYRLRNKFFKHKQQSICEIPDSLKKIKKLIIHPERKGKFSDYFTKEDIKLVEELDLDFILRFGLNIIRGEILTVPRYGIWSFHHGDPAEYRGGPPCFWEVYHNRSSNGAILQRINDRLDAGIILKSGTFSVTNHSWRETLNNTYNQSAKWVKQVCIDIKNNCADYLKSSSATSKAPVYTFPKNGIMINYFFKKLIRKGAFHYNRLFRVEKWQLRIEENCGTTILFHKQKENYYADGFIFHYNNKEYILAEEFSYKSGKGNIVLFINRIKIKSLFNDKVHRSYPYIFQEKKKIYCLPESAESGKIILYEFDENKEELTEAAVLVNDVNAYDPTLLHKNDKWWLFFTTKQNGSGTSLFIYHSNSLFEEFLPHNNNPVKQNIKSARPAGTIYKENGKWVRPSQNCAKTYGGKITLNEILILNEYEFKEQKCGEILPRLNFYGLHHLNKSSDITLMDEKKYVFSFYNFIRVLKLKK